MQTNRGLALMLPHININIFCFIRISRTLPYWIILGHVLCLDVLIGWTSPRGSHYMIADWTRVRQDGGDWMSACCNLADWWTGRKARTFVLLQRWLQASISLHISGHPSVLVSHVTRVWCHVTRLLLPHWSSS